MSSRSTPVNADSIMPFGKYSGRPLRKVPAWYWKWLIVQPFCRFWPALEKWALDMTGYTFENRPPIKEKAKKAGPPLPPSDWITGENYVEGGDDVPF